MPLLSSLGLPSLSQTVLAFFRAAGIASVEDFLVHDLYSLVSLASHQQQSEQYKQAVTDILVYLEDNHAMWCDGIDMLNIIQQTRSFLPTGCERHCSMHISMFTCPSYLWRRKPHHLQCEVLSRSCIIFRALYAPRFFPALRSRLET